MRRVEADVGRELQQEDGEPLEQSAVGLRVVGADLEASAQIARAAATGSPSRTPPPRPPRETATTISRAPSRAASASGRRLRDPDSIWSQAFDRQTRKTELIQRITGPLQEGRKNRKTWCRGSAGPSCARGGGEDRKPARARRRSGPPPAKARRERGGAEQERDAAALAGGELEAPDLAVVELSHVGDERRARARAQSLVEGPEVVLVAERADDEPAGEVAPRPGPAPADRACASDGSTRAGPCGRRPFRSREGAPRSLRSRRRPCRSRSARPDEVRRRGPRRALRIRSGGGRKGRRTPPPADSAPDLRRRRTRPAPE